MSILFYLIAGLPAGIGKRTYPDKRHACRDFFVIESSMKILMVVIVLGTLGLATWISGVGIVPFVVVDAVIPVVIVPAVLVMIGISPSQFAGAFRTAFQPDDASDDKLVTARAVLKSFSRMIGISVALFVTVGVIAMIHDLPSGPFDPAYYLLKGSGTLLVDLLYALILQGMVVQPLIIRLKLASGRSAGDAPSIGAPRESQVSGGRE